MLYLCSSHYTCIVDAGSREQGVLIVQWADFCTISLYNLAGLE